MNKPAQSKPWLKPLILVGVFAVVLVSLWKTGLLGYFDTSNLQGSVESFRGFIQSLGIWGPIVYIAIYILCTIFMVPGTVPTLAAGVFGVIWGTLYVSIASTTGAALAFLLARYSLRPMIEGWAAKNSAFQKIDKGVEQHGWRMVMITRLVPLFPFNLQNYAYGLTKVRFVPYVFFSWLFMLPGTYVYVSLTGAILEGKGDVKKIGLYLGLAAIVFVGLSFLPRILKKKYNLESETADS